MSTSPSRPPGGGPLVKMLVLGLLALVLGVPLTFLHWRRDQQLAWLAQRSCPSTIGRIGMFVAAYQMDNAGAVPPDLDSLQRYAQKELGGGVRDLFTCPYAKARGVAPKQPGAVCMSSFVYVVPPGITHYSQIEDPGETVCAYEPPEDHDGLGTPILFWDGHSTWYDVADARRIIERGRTESVMPQTQRVR